MAIAGRRLDCRSTLYFPHAGALGSSAEPYAVASRPRLRIEGQVSSARRCDWWPWAGQPRSSRPRWIPVGPSRHPVGWSGDWPSPPFGQGWQNDVMRRVLAVRGLGGVATAPGPGMLVESGPGRVGAFNMLGIVSPDSRPAGLTTAGLAVPDVGRWSNSSARGGTACVASHAAASETWRNTWMAPRWGWTALST